MPLVLHGEKLMFLHAAKTGGTWIRFVFEQLGIFSEDVGDQHANFFFSQEIYRGYQRFTIVRNPFSWYASYWAYKQYEGWKGNWNFGEGCISDDFNTFIHLATTYRPGFLAGLFSEFTDPSVVILRNELLATDLCSFLTQENVPFDKQIVLNTPSVNPGASLPEFQESTIYTEESIKKVVQSERQLFSQYSYSTDPFMFHVRVT